MPERLVFCEIFRFPMGTSAREGYPQSTQKSLLPKWRFPAMARQRVLLEYWEFLKYRKKFWLLPIVTVLLMFGGLLCFASGSAIMPFFYMFF